MDSETPPPDVIAEMYAPPARRWLGLSVNYLLGLLLIGLVVTHPPENAVWLIFLILTAAAAFWAAEKMRQATAHGLRLTEDGLWETGGRRIVALDDIEKVDRGTFAFKPSNGFLVTTRKPMQRTWRPGLYWVWGHRIGVGGVTSRSQAKLMADTINMVLAERRGGPSNGL